MVLTHDPCGLLPPASDDVDAHLCWEGGLAAQGLADPWTKWLRACWRVHGSSGLNAPP